MASTSVGAFYFANMSDSDPIQAIDAWQKWYKENQVVASLDEPMASKDLIDFVQVEVHQEDAVLECVFDRR